MFFHILCVTDKTIIEKNLTVNDINRIFADFKNKHVAILNGFIVKQSEIKRFKIVKSEFDYDLIWNKEFYDGQTNGMFIYPNETIVFDSNEVIDVTRDFIK